MILVKLFGVLFVGKSDTLAAWATAMERRRNRLAWKKREAELVVRLAREESLDTRAYELASRAKRLSMREHNNNRTLQEFGVGS